MTSRKESPRTASFLASMDKPYTGAYAEEISSNANVVGNLNSQFKYDQVSEGPYQEMSKGASVKNKYLEKIAMSGIAKAVGSASGISKASLGMSAAGLGLSVANYHNGKNTAMATQNKVDLERKSLNALNKINTTLSTATLSPSSMAVQRPIENKGKV